MSSQMTGKIGGSIMSKKIAIILLAVATWACAASSPAQRSAQINNPLHQHKRTIQYPEWTWGSTIRTKIQTPQRL